VGVAVYAVVTVVGAWEGVVEWKTKGETGEEGYGEGQVEAVEAMCSM